MYLYEARFHSRASAKTRHNGLSTEAVMRIQQSSLKPDSKRDLQNCKIMPLFSNLKCFSKTFIFKMNQDIIFEVQFKF